MGLQINISDIVERKSLKIQEDRVDIELRSIEYGNHELNCPKIDIPAVLREIADNVESGDQAFEIKNYTEEDEWLRH